MTYHNVALTLQRFCSMLKTKQLYWVNEEIKIENRSNLAFSDTLLKKKCLREINSNG